jgi:hypothetical protein
MMTKWSWDLRVESSVCESPESFADVLGRLHREGYTGAVLVHFGQGVPSEVQVLSPESRIRLDKRKSKPQT